MQSTTFSIFLFSDLVLLLGEHSNTFFLSHPQLGEHVALAQVPRPRRPELKVRLILDRLPVAAPFEAELQTQRADRFVGGRFIKVTSALEHADIEGDTEVVVRVTATRVRDDAARLRATLFVKRVLLIVGARAGDDLKLVLLLVVVVVVVV